MRDLVFLYKDNEDFRDCVKYSQVEQGEKIETCGACFWGGLYVNDLDFDNITTILTKDEFFMLDKYNNGEIEWQDIAYIIEKLKSDENIELFKQVQKEEIEYMKDEYSLSDDDIEQIFDNYAYEHRDRAIIGGIHNNCEDLATYYIENCLELDKLPNIITDNIDYENIGIELLELGECYYQLEDERIIEYAY